MQRPDYEAPELERLCAAHDVSADVAFELLWQIELLLIEKLNIASDRKTVTVRAKQLEAIVKYANQLQEAVEALDFIDRSALDSECFGVNKPGFERMHELANGPEAFDLGGFAIPAIRQAATAVQGRLNGVGKAGAPSNTAAIADYIRCVAQALEPTGIEPTHEGPFQQICEAVFNAAGVAFPVRAMRYFKKHIWPSAKGQRWPH